MNVELLAIYLLCWLAVGFISFCVGTWLDYKNGNLSWSYDKIGIIAGLVFSCICGFLSPVLIYCVFLGEKEDSSL